MDFLSFSSAWYFFDTNSLPNFVRSPRVFLKSTTLGRKIVCSVIYLNSCFSQLNTKSFSILTFKLPFWKCVTYALGCSFIKSSLLRINFNVCCQLNNIKQHAWWIEKVFKKKEGFQSKNRGIFRIQLNICDGAYLWKELMVIGGNRKLRSVTEFGIREFGIPNSQTQKL